ncbi:MAG: DUF6580 family putative transport protein [Saprospiraceae bacterium]|jgi:hypothetical protein|nr:hypothetical protein [Saprospiraceae bacterium]
MKKSNNTVAVMLLMIAGAFSRFIPHVPNFTPTEGLTIFGAAYLGKKYLPYIFPLVLMYISDFIINNTSARIYFTNTDGLVWYSPYMIFNLIAIILIVFIACKLLRKVTVTTTLGAVISASIIFYIISNFGVWMNGTSFYSKDFSGLLQSYVAGLPFFRTSLISNLFFSTVIFGSYHILKSLFYRNEAVHS